MLFFAEGAVGVAAGAAALGAAVGAHKAANNVNQGGCDNYRNYYPLNHSFFSAVRSFAGVSVSG